MKKELMMALTEDFQIWFTRSIERGDHDDMITVHDVINRFEEFMRGWGHPGLSNRVAVGIMIREMVTKLGWDAYKTTSVRPIGWTRLRWRKPDLVTTLAEKLPEFLGWFDEMLEPAPGGMITYNEIRAHHSDEAVGLLLREVARTRGLTARPDVHGRWHGLQWRVSNETDHRSA